MALMGQDSLKANLTNPARTFLWDVLVPVPVGGGDSTTFQVRAQSSQIPGRKNEPISIPYKQTSGIRVSGKLAFDHTWTCEFLEGEDKKVFDAIHAWQQQITHDVAGVGIGDPLYKTDVYITLQQVAGGTFMKLKLRGAWISDVGQVSLSYADNAVIKYSVTFNYDSWEDAT